MLATLRLRSVSPHTLLLALATNTIVTAMVAASFGSYASAAFTGSNETWAKAFGVLIVVVMTVVNIAGSQVVARAQTVIVYVVLGILTVFAVVTIANINGSLLAPYGYPPLHKIVSSVALTFFAFLGFGIVTFTAKDLAKPERELPKAMYLAIGIATIIYVAVALGVFGTLTVEQVISSGATALAVAAQPALGDAGYRLMSVTGLFATAGATNGGLYPAAGLCEQLASTGLFPPVMGRRLGGRAAMGLLISAAGAIVLTAGFGLTAIASIGSAAALLIFMLITVAHFRVRSETGARVWILVLALATTGITFLTFVVTTLTTEPASIVALVVILLLSVLIDFGWKRSAGSAAPTAEIAAGAE
jgi:amino acid transporter